MADQEFESVRYAKFFNVFFLMQGESLDKLNVAKASNFFTEISVQLEDQHEKAYKFTDFFSENGNLGASHFCDFGTSTGLDKYQILTTQVEQLTPKN